MEDCNKGNRYSRQNIFTQSVHNTMVPKQELRPKSIDLFWKKNFADVKPEEPWKPEGPRKTTTATETESKTGDEPNPNIL